jgi:hypothetical protein
VDFYKLKTKRTKEGLFVYPDFIVQSSKDILVKGGAFHAVWDEARGLWSRNEMDVARMVDEDLLKKATEDDAIPLLMSSFESKSWTGYKNYISSLEDSDEELDQSLTFANDPPDRKKFASRRLPYSLTEAECPAYEELMSTLYEPEEREKLEWSAGSIIAGDSKKNQKFLVLYGPPGSGKGTWLNICEALFNGYYIPFDAKAMGSANNNFSLAGFKRNPLLAIQHDGDLSRIEDNTKLNQIVSHEIISINDKYKSEFYARAIAFLMLGTNEPVKITGAKSGIIRRLIDVHPSGRKIPEKHYLVLMNQVQFELGAIAQHCLGVYYKLGKQYYSSYRPTAMMYETDVFYNFVESAYESFYEADGVELQKAWAMYKEFCEDALIRHKLPRHQFRSELMNYFENYEERVVVNGKRLRSYFSGFKTQRFVKVDETKPISMVLDETKSLLDDVLADMPAQYAKADGFPTKYWTDTPIVKGVKKQVDASQVVDTKLRDLDTSKLHYVQVPENLIVIDFDLKDEHGNKSRERNLEAAAEWPPTYAEFSQGGEGVHLHYYYDGPGHVAELNPLHSDGIEVKSLIGNAALRRRVSGCNRIEIATLTSGLALKEKPMRDEKAMSSEKTIRRLIIENLQKKHHPGTKPSIDFIKHILDEAFASGIPYDVSDLHPDVYSFAMDSSNHARYCMKVVQEMKFMSEDMELQATADNEQLVFYDVEVFPNLFVICWKYAGTDNIVRMINPSADECEELVGKKLIGFNCRRYDNHILYAASQGYTREQLYDISQRIISNDRSAMFGAAYDVSYVDIYDFSSKKQSLKKFEIELGLHHLELGLPWDQPVPEEKWTQVADYCANDVEATEATFNARHADFVARQILAELSGLPINASTQMHTAKIIFGSEKKPQRQFVYTDLSQMFEGYEYDFGKSTYRGEVVGEGGYVYAEPGYYKNVALLDVASMHPSSIELLNAFGPYTEKFSDLKAARLAIKRGDYEAARRMLDGRLAPYLEEEEQAEALSYALKIVINIVYGLTSAKFENAFRDPRNKDNIVAKRGALFMIELKHACQEKGLKVVHIKTDSIKIPDATEEDIAEIVAFGKRYGYDFEHEATYDQFALFNEAVYIAHDPEKGWSATGAQFQHPYIFKTLLSNEPVTFEDLLETRNVVKGEIHIITHNEAGEEESDRFVGRIGQFVPVLPGNGGGSLMRVSKNDAGEVLKHAVAGTKGYLWLEAETVKKAEIEDQVDMRYYQDLLEKAQDAMAKVGFHL